MKSFRFFITYASCLVASALTAFCLNYIGLNEALKEYYDFIGDILGFSSILTGFLGAIISVLTSISKSSPIITRVLKSKKALRQFILSMAIPFCLGFLVIFVSMLFRLKLHNENFLDGFGNLNIFLLTLTIYLVLTSILMTVVIFYIFFLDGLSDSSKERKSEFKPRLKRK